MVRTNNRDTCGLYQMQYNVCRDQTNSALAQGFRSPRFARRQPFACSSLPPHDPSPTPHNARLAFARTQV